jgi:hypothetical protein
MYEFLIVKVGVGRSHYVTEKALGDGPKIPAGYDSIYI